MEIKGFKVGGVTYNLDYPPLDDKPTIDSSLSDYSANAVQDKVVKAALDHKAPACPQLEALRNFPPVPDATTSGVLYCTVSDGVKTYEWRAV